MEEADLLKERLQAITDKRRIQEDIARKRRQIEEEKLKLQYIKKKALREQWLMDGLSQQSEQEQEAMRLQAQDEQQQSDQLQTNILRIEKEVEELETQELNISANEELVLKRLKEVERTPEDIIKEFNADVRPDVMHHDLPSCTSVTPVRTPPVCQAEGEEPKRATFAMAISVELDKRTGRTQVVSTASVTPETVEGRGLKVYDDGRKSVYALHPEGGGVRNGAMTPLQVEELLRQATDQDLDAEVQLHPPVYSAPYAGNTRPPTPRTPSRRPTPTPSPALAETQQGPVNQDSPSVAPPPNSTSPAQSERRWTPQCDGRAAVSSNPAALVAVTARAGGLPAPTQPLYRAVDTHNPLVKSPGDVTGRSPSEGVASLHLVTAPPDESQPVTMIFMGYEKAEDGEDEDVQAELVVIGNSDDDDDDDDEGDEGDEGGEGAESVSFHPQGYRSRVFQPPVARATVRGPRDQNQHWDQDQDQNQDQNQLLRPTFTHKTRSGRGGSEMKLCSTGR